MVAFDYFDGGELLCGRCKEPCAAHFRDERGNNDVGECCAPKADVTAAVREHPELVALLDAAPDFYECPRCGGDALTCDHGAQESQEAALDAYWDRKEHEARDEGAIR